MFSKLFRRAVNDKAASLKPIESRPHGGPAAFAYRHSEDQDERDIAGASLAAEIFLAEDEQRTLKQRGDVVKIVRRQGGRYFNQQNTPEVKSRANSFDSLVDEHGFDWSPATVWAAGLQCDPLWLDAVERESMSPPDWAVTTAIEAVGGHYKPTMFDWLEPFNSPELPQSPQSPPTSFAAWCENLINSAFRLQPNDAPEDDLSDETEADAGKDDARNGLDEFEIDRMSFDEPDSSRQVRNFEADDDFCDLPIRVDELDYKYGFDELRVVRSIDQTVDDDNGDVPITFDEPEDYSVRDDDFDEDNDAVPPKSLVELKAAQGGVHQGFVIHEAPFIEADSAVVMFVG